MSAPGASPGPLVPAQSAARHEAVDVEEDEQVAAPAEGLVGAEVAGRGERQLPVVGYVDRTADDVDAVTGQGAISHQTGDLRITHRDDDVHVGPPSGPGEGGQMRP
ncbi:hypothetical protein BA895_07905 [Humibacillus sp. DSM 29435]|nr:hypothetical protein BA895_07905 [Humibacillus sp. DSM 29435]